MPPASVFLVSPVLPSSPDEPLVFEPPNEPASPCDPDFPFPLLSDPPESPPVSPPLCTEIPGLLEATGIFDKAAFVWEVDFAKGDEDRDAGFGVGLMAGAAW